MSEEQRRFRESEASDCPVQPHVWREYQRRGGEESLELIAHLRPGRPKPIVATMLHSRIRHDEGGGTVLPKILIYEDFLLVDAPFDAMFVGVLPMTSWGALIVKLSKVAPTMIEAELNLAKKGDNVEEAGDLTEEALWSGMSSDELRRTRWMMSQLAQMEWLDAARVTDMVSRAVSRVWKQPMLQAVGYNRWTEPAVHQTRDTIKADAAASVFSLDYSRVRWAVLDTGIDQTHPAFMIDGRSTVVEAYDIPKGIAAARDKDPDAIFTAMGSGDINWEDFKTMARVDPPPSDGSEPQLDPHFKNLVNDHGTHVAGVLAAAPHNLTNLSEQFIDESSGEEPASIMGVCPGLELVDIRVFDSAGRSREFDVVVGLAFVRWLNSVNERQIDGANLSLAVPFAVDNFACGWTPVCLECDRLVSSGVVVVASAGNSGFDDSRGDRSLGAGFRLVSIADPGNTDKVITVGATHRTDPHRYGPISRSARGPTADGRHKPDLLAPGVDVWGPVPGKGWAEKTGTSQAAPHVSGVAAMLIARFPELRGRPDRIKQILMETATDLERLADFQGAGLVDALRALQHP